MRLTPKSLRRLLMVRCSETTVPMAAAQLRAPLYEDKVVDFLFDKAEITERTVTKAELEAAIGGGRRAKGPCAWPGL